VITAAGLWACVLIVWRIFDKQGTSRHGQVAYTSGIEWGIFVALAVAALLAYAGSLIRLAHEPEPPLPGEGEPLGPVARRPRRGWKRRGEEPRRRPAPRAYPGPDMGADDDWTQEFRARRQPASPPPARPAAPELSEAPTQADPGEAPTRRVRPRSIAAPEEKPGGGAPRPAPSAAPEASEPLRTSEPPAAEPSRRRRPLDRREIQELELEEPPTVRLGRSAPAQPRSRSEPEAPTERQPHGDDPRPDDSHEQLTIRTDRPD
jgi:hypothetical protein